MLCQECKENPATVHITKIRNNIKTEIHLCKRCAAKREDTELLTSFSINDLLTSFLGSVKSTATADTTPLIRCDECGMDYRQFKKTGRFGCENCYKEFRDEIHPIIKRIQGGAVKHTGKIPLGQRARIRTNREMEELKQKLQGAINTEAFEEAARLRDLIRDLEKKQAKEG